MDIKSTLDGLKPPTEINSTLIKNGPLSVTKEKETYVTDSLVEVKIEVDNHSMDFIESEDFEHSKLGTEVHQSKPLPTSACEESAIPNTIKDTEQAPTIHHDDKGRITGGTRPRKPPKRFDCEICGKSMPRISKLEQHLRTHNPNAERPFVCELCDRGFFDEIQLKRHILMHSDVLPYACDICSRRYAAPTSLRRHYRKHSGDKPYVCEICQKAHMDACGLKRHMRSHSGEKPFECKVCKKSFAQSGHLRVHVRGHTGEKPYKCSICEKGFASRGAMNRHVRIHFVQTKCS